MKLAYHDRQIEIDQTWSRAALRMGMQTFTLAEDGFAETLSENRPPAPFEKSLSAIYFWRAENGEAYVGQAVDVQSRLRQHYKNHRDLVCAAFVPVAPEALDREERRLVALAETDFRMRNVKLVRDSASFRPLDEFLTSEEQSEFVSRGNRLDWLQENRREFPMLETRTRVKFAKFQGGPSDGSILQGIISEFIVNAIPRPQATENRFWSVTFLDEGFARVNVGQQEVMTCQERLGRHLIRLLAPKRYSLFARRSPYETRDFESFVTLGKLKRILRSARSMQSMRSGVIWLARHTTPMNNRSHCPWLFDPEIAGRI